MQNTQKTPDLLKMKVILSAIDICPICDKRINAEKKDYVGIVEGDSKPFFYAHRECVGTLAMLRQLSRSVL